MMKIIKNANTLSLVTGSSGEHLLQIFYDLNNCTYLIIKYIMKLFPNTQKP